MSTTTTTTRKTAGGCGCRGACSCHSAASNPAHGPLARPVFFAGQLLTEDDLQGLSNYVVAKNRLRNRHLFGSGVVCGLEVRPSPCDSRSVIVDPGYAIDGCGNDIVVDTPLEPIDVFAMIRALRAGIRGGYDCGDPCAKAADPAPPPPPRTSTTPATTTTTKSTNAQAPKNPIAPLPQVYELYLAYAEVQTGFVMPYETGDCGTSGCQASVIGEGYRFELRCPPAVPDTRSPSATLADRIEACLEEIGGEENAKTVVDTLETLRTARKVLVQSGALIMALVAKPGDLDKDLKAVADRLTRSDDGILQLQTIHKALTLVFRSRLLDPAVPAHNPIIKDAADVLEAAKDRLSKFTDPRFDASTKALGTMKDELDLNAGSPPWPQNSKADTFGKQARIAGEDVDLDRVNKALADLHQKGDDLLRRQRDGVIALDAPRIAILKGASFQEVTEATTNKIPGEIWEDSVSRADVIFRVLSDCYCDSLAVPCDVDDGSAVLLATIDVGLDDCRVLSVCNQARTSLLTGPAIRYWLSQVEDWFDASRQLCCPGPDAAADEAKAIAQHKADDESQWAANASVVTDWPTTPDPTAGSAVAPETHAQRREAVSAALVQLAGFTGRAADSVATGLNPFRLGSGTTTDDSAIADLRTQVKTLVDLDLPGAVTTLQNALNDLKSSTDQELSDLKKRIVALENDDQTLFAGWAKVVNLSKDRRRAFLKSEFKKLLTPTGQTNIKNADKTRSLAGLFADNLNHFAGFGSRVRTAVTTTTPVNNLANLDTEGLLKVVAAVAPAGPPTPGEEGDVNLLLDEVSTLVFLVDRWPDAAMPDLTI